jgi:hypothetical protein
MAARKKSRKSASASKPAAKKAASKAPAKVTPKKRAESVPAGPAKAPKPGSKEEHYADLRRVALANALARLR